MHTARRVGSAAALRTGNTIPTECFQNQIFTLFFPSNIIYLTELLDVGVFGPLLRYCTKYICNKIIQQPGTYPKPILKGNFIKFENLHVK